MFCFLNTVAIIYNSQAALPFGTILVIMFLWNQARTLTQTRTRTLITRTLNLTLSLTQVIMFIWMLVTLPLTVIGGIVGRNMAKGKDFDAPCRTNKIPREVPPIPWYRQGPCQVFMAGFLPFSAIYIELHYIFASVWGHKLYTLYGILFTLTPTPTPNPYP